ncbi:MAG: FMN-binding negative transcriptional regulator [Candidatus Oceanisphaera merdipullorum]|nr:FMN-binding negative transcriptional regulator [Candidatus Oceanisphaera merdipullorum]
MAVILKEDDAVKLQPYIRGYSFGTWVIADEQGIEVNHVPFYLSPAADWW